MTQCEAFTLLMWDCCPEGSGQAVPRNDVPINALPSLRGTKQSVHYIIYV